MMAKDFESFGAHIRNMLSPYANIVQILEDISNGSDNKDILENFIFDKKRIQNLKENLEHFIEFSKLEELEKLNWRDTNLFNKS
jgi:hypothetical protein